MSNPFEELLRHALDEREAPRPKIPAEGVIARLREYAARAHAPCPFQPGDIVTPRRGGLIREQAVGRPCLVLEVFPQVIADPQGENGTPEYLRRSDMRVVEYSQSHDCVVEKVAASWEFELWTEGASAGVSKND